MLQLQELINQRQDRRFQIKNRAFAMLANWTIRFEIIDISSKGLAFRYIGKEKWFSDLNELDLLYGEDFCLKKFPIISISDYTISKSFIPMRRHSVMFHKLQPHQQDQLQQFIRNCAKGNA